MLLSNPVLSAMMKKPLLLFSLLLVVFACKDGQLSSPKSDKADSMITAANLSENYDRVFELVDSFEKAGDISFIQAGQHRGETYLQMKKLHEAEEVYKKVIAGPAPKNMVDSIRYFSCVTDLVQILSLRKDHDAVLLTAVPLLETLQNLSVAPEYAQDVFSMRLMLGFYLGNSQQYIGKHAEAAKSFNFAYEAVLKSIEIDSSWASLYNSTMILNNIVTAYMDDDDYDNAALWLVRNDSVAAKFYVANELPESYASFVKGLMTYTHAVVALTQNRNDEAFRYFGEYQKQPSSQTMNGRYQAASFLRRAHRYAEAADGYQCLDQLMKEYQLEPSVDYVGMVKGKYEANLKAGRKDSALAAATFALDFLDSAIVRQRKSEAIRLATVYETKLKDEQIASQQADLNRQRFLAIAVAFVLLIVFFIVYTLFRRRAAKRLAEVKAAQERIESELRIARDIQMSMVPNTFPEYDGLDLYASMTPAKEVGGDLYGYLINGNNLYFAVGDVSGKGVPASLFMAQATRLFRTMAAQGITPAEICTYMNAELSGEDNVSGMFVTMFVGMLDMQNGHLTFCNAGHNPPVIGGGDNHGDFLEMIPNAPIGLWPDLEYEGEEIDTIKGRALFVYTDGLNEAENTQQKQFGDDRLLSILRNTHFDTARQVVETLYAEVEKHRAGAEPNDDLTMLCLRVS